MGNIQINRVIGAAIKEKEMLDLPDNATIGNIRAALNNKHGIKGWKICTTQLGSGLADGISVTSEKYFYFV